MKTNQQNTNWWLDAGMGVGYLFCFSLDFTGLIGHELLGILVGGLAFVHLMIHVHWVTAVGKRFFKGTNARNRWYFLIDLSLFLGFAAITGTGLVISSFLNLNLPNYDLWRVIHIGSAVLTLGVLVVKINLHRHWIINVGHKIFGRRAPQPSRSPQPVPVLVPVPVDQRRIDRRQFLGMMGVVGVGSALAVSNLLSESTLRKVNAVTAETGSESLSASASQAVTATQNTAAEESVASSAAQVSTETVEPMVTENPQPTATVIPSQAAANCQVRCPRGCSFPGHCRRYTDQNGNGYCDLGECL
ncbi:MAG: DUF4405 domain-containing protein [Anaerolineaceae bacterium]|nr:DUF4405 domain-containing protein [Anaerolineaceae bacterium]